MNRLITQRLKGIQTVLGVEADGILGNDTLTALEKRLRIHPQDAVADTSSSATSTAEHFRDRMTLSRSGIGRIVSHEIGSPAYYEARLQHPIWPGGDSGVTIGIGYDLGYTTAESFQADWSAYLSPVNLDKLATACGKKKTRAKRAIRLLKKISIPYAAALAVFTHTSLPVYAARTCKAFPGVEQLHPDAQAALLSLVYNRGGSRRGDSRREMQAIHELVPGRDYAAIASELKKMKRLWEGKGLDGLLKRRDEEAAMVLAVDSVHEPEDLVQV